jgi:hypothetical protein
VAAPTGAPSGGNTYGEGGGDRAQSYRVFALILVLMTLVMIALIGAVGLVAASIYTQGESGDQAKNQQVLEPAPRKRGSVDTGVEPPKVEPVPKPRPRPRPSGGGGAAPAPRPAPAPAPPPAPPSGPIATVTITTDGAISYTGIEVSCPTGGYRSRANFAGTSASLAGVPREDCTMKFKGGEPNKITLRMKESISCNFPSGIAVCR